MDSEEHQPAKTRVEEEEDDYCSICHTVCSAEQGCGCVEPDLDHQSLGVAVPKLSTELWRCLMTVAELAVRIGLKRILVATEFSECSERALLAALRIAQRYGSHLHVVHVVPSEGYGVIGVGMLGAVSFARHNVKDLESEFLQKGYLEGIRYQISVPREEKFGRQFLVSSRKPAALECVLHHRNADKVKANIIAEAANLTTAPDADVIFRSDITVLPDILMNAGGVVVSYFEWTQNLQRVYWEEGKVDSELHRYMTRAYRDVANLAQSIRFRCGRLRIGSGSSGLHS
jgi:nucleotide-binding universal stress UspA family protein